MRLRVLGSSGSEFPGHHSPAFLLDGKLLLDAGTIGLQLNGEEQGKIRNICITHAHLDHIKGIPFLADNLISRKPMKGIVVYGIRESLKAMKDHLLNDSIWPDFTRIPTNGSPVIRLKNISAGRQMMIDGYAVTAFRVTHAVPAVGYRVRDRKGRVLVYTGDTGPTSEIWNAPDRVSALIIEVSFPNSMGLLAEKTGHLTPQLLVRELAKMKHCPGRILITHPKPQYRDLIRKETGKIRNCPVEILKDGREYEI